MGTLVCFHAHPDDEALSTGGSMARAHAEGHRVVLVVATNGEHGEVPDDLADGETLVDRRRRETAESADRARHRPGRLARVPRLGDDRLGAEPDPESFLQADLDEAAGRLADVLRDEDADVLTIYDWHGNYGHPDHIQVHRVGVRAAEMVADELPRLRVFEATLNRDAIVRMIASAAEAGTAAFGDEDEEFDPNGPADDGNPFGMSEAELTHEVDVSDYVTAKRSSISSHRSQVTDTGFFLSMSEEMFASAFSKEWFIERGREPGMHPGWLFDE